MLKSLTLTNVRRHADTHIDFTGDGQLIALSGFNGAGKSTILEGLLYALYGETRHGRSGISGMVRRGAEHEGMQVGLEFSIDGIDYEVQRRYEKGKSTASLTVSGVETMRSVAAVTAEIGRIFGMDAAGFKLATIAKQKELDGLADLTPAKRRAAVARLLRLDAVQDAARAARDQFTRNRDIAKALGSQSDTAAATTRLAEATKQHDEAKRGLEDVRAIIAELDAQLAASAGVAALWEQSQRDILSTQASLDSAAAQVAALTSQRDAIAIPDEPGPSRDIALIDAELASLSATIMAGEQAARDAQSRARIVADMEDNDRKLAASQDWLDKLTGRDLDAELNDAKQSVIALNDKVTELREGAGLAQQEVVRTETGIAALRSRVASLGSLGAVCTACEQEINADHQHAQLHSATVELQAAEQQVHQQRTHAEQARAALKNAEQATGPAGDLVQTLLALTRQRQQVLETRESLTRAQQTYAATLERLPNVDIDMEQAYQAKGHLDAERAAAAAADVVNRRREQALAQLASVQASLQEASARLEQAQLARQQAQPDVDLVESHQQRTDWQTRRDCEAQMLVGMSDLVSQFAGEVRGAKAAVDAAESLAQQAREHSDKAMVSSLASDVLTSVARTLATEIRPALQAEVASLLETLSEGRFTNVNISEDYDVTIADDDGSFHSVSDYSGGESDLIALAIRLALAQIVSRRHGAGACGFLILDEVLGSQDAGRRLSILDGLRRLRSTYGQILLISHVGGLEDAADRVIDVQTFEGVATAA